MIELELSDVTLTTSFVKSDGKGVLSYFAKINGKTPVPETLLKVAGLRRRFWRK